MLFVKPGFLCDPEWRAIAGQRTIRNDQRLKLSLLSLGLNDAKEGNESNEGETFLKHGVRRGKPHVR
jgi:hypothetical protein